MSSFALGGLRIGDHLMDEDGDIYVVKVKEPYKLHRSFGNKYYNFGLLCLTDPMEDIVWARAEAKIVLGDEWVWHSRRGALV